jgi:hypothetical protein
VTGRMVSDKRRVLHSGSAMAVDRRLLDHLSAECEE